MIFCYFFSAPRTFSLTFRPFFISIWIPSLIPVITARRLNFCEGTLSVNTYIKVESFLNSTVLSGTASTLLARASKVLAVPESTVEFKNDSTFIYVLTDSVPSQKFSRRAVITGMSDGIQIEIKNGLNVNEKVRGAEKK